ncbi:hypothetical protein FBY10_10153 [Pseudomonas sp. SJZ103]|uniref:hypothetical protein n=1 Tax=unclassified Pseudomonas TaxID=196821 RepID=UPI0011A31568|nr:MULTISPECIES: hypothetical protein [unclassified Pseudomonas]TWC74365.1 hypothetical protein FBY10_10153 [Pseudomonas sp. SJZ103]TWC93506.1 hypothetical protein FBY08_1011005 [Pseudomonas sp. SJZ094]
MDKSIAGSQEWESPAPVHNAKGLHKRDLKLGWDRILGELEQAGNWEALADRYGRAGGFVDALYWADQIDQENADVLKAARDKAHKLATERLSGGSQ